MAIICIYFDRDINEKLYFFNTFLIQLVDTHAPFKAACMWLTENVPLVMPLGDKYLLKEARLKRRKGSFDYYKQI